jgi:hypothetical protein
MRDANKHQQHGQHGQRAQQGVDATSARDAPDARDGTVVLVGGHGGMSDRYREVAEERGLELRHFEKRVPSGVRRTLGNVVAVVIVVGMVSHTLRDQVRSLVGDAKIVYVRTASVSALRAAVEEMTPARRPAGTRAA